MRRIKRWLCGGMCLLLLLGLLPAAAQAEEGTAAWAGEAVETLCKIYGSDLGVSDSLEPMTKAQAAAVFTNMGNTAVAATLTGQGNLTRGEACTALTQAFAIPTGEKAAILYLYERNIINGKSADELDENGTVSCADFAVLTCRVLNFVGGGLGSSVEQLKPGTEAYFAWMYLAARRCVAFQSNQLETSMDRVSDFSTYDGIDETASTDDSTVVEVETAPKSGKGIWDAWVAALSEPRIGGLKDFGEDLKETYQENETMKAAATRLMGAFISAYTAQYDGSAPTIFTDVTMENWWYDGVMYSFDAGYISGLGNGTFEPNYRLPLYEFAVLLYRINPVEAGELENITLPFLKNGDFSEYEQAVMGNQSVQNAMKAAIKEGYFSWAAWEDEDFDPTATAARKDAISDILKACAAGKGVELDLDSVNPSVLDRFEDTKGLEDPQKRYLAYAVSCGMVNGTSATNLSPDEPVSRADAGVLLYRMLIGLDESKMHDYEQNIQNALD